MELSMKVTRDIVVTMIEHGCFDNLPIEKSDSGVLPRDEVMAMEICKVYSMLFKTALNLESSGLDTMEQLYLGENQV